ncbi:MAG: 2,3-diphosphoglycerate-dependent phosphoglycerate mutase [Gammaproteobacteria bacterium]|jgi:2,3-bisphosphoglycerate-dependent phosphoglycerate mutase|nr:2,3-diphosphoglycerate-dependent phosphoglycerate mutase [Gammaproteobacteria bacterium]|tara:strand:+ start:1833 stop:2573 length:741 start_codon:yes stop_codon:yes gene_type:complete
MAGKLILCRHGQSEWNLENRFTGWADVDLSPKGEQEAKDAGLTLKHEQLSFDLAYTSVLKRATRTLWIMLEEMSLTWIPVTNAWELNERHYGALQGLNKSQVAAEYGEEQVQIWRRSYDTPPPALNDDDERHPRFEIRYASVSDLPASESLKDTLLRVKPYWQTKIIPSLLGNQDVLIVAHGNSLRAMVKMIENISDEEIVDFNIPTGIPLAYEFNENLKPIKQGFIGDPETIKQATQAVANQGLA